MNTEINHNILSFPRKAYRSFGFAVATSLLLSGCDDSSSSASPPNFTLSAISSASECGDPSKILLTNADILTVDESNPSATSVYIVDGIIVAVDDTSDVANDACRIDLEGKTVIPGLNDNHVHYMSSMFSPGYYYVGIENANSMEELLAGLTERTAEVPEGALITAIGALPVSAVGGLPTGDDLTAAAPDNPVYMAAAFNFGPGTNVGVVNEQGRQLLEASGVTVNADGTVDDFFARNALSAFESAETKEAGAIDYMAWTNSLGVTMVGDSGGSFADAQLLKDFNADGKLSVKMRVRSMSNFFGGAPRDPETGIWPIFPLTEALMELIGEGDSMLKTNGVGEWSFSSIPFTGTVSEPLEDFYEVWTEVAQRGWSLEQHALGEAEIETYLVAFEAVNGFIPLADLHWSVAHANSITADQLARLNALGMGIGVHNVAYLQLGFPVASHPLPAMIDSGITLAGGSDSTNIAPFNPWLAFYTLTTGRNVTGTQVHPDESLVSREDVLKMYTLGSAWMSSEEDEIGSIEVGKVADIAVLNQDFLEVGDEDLRGMRSVLTLVDGRVVHLNPDL